MLARRSHRIALVLAGIVLPSAAAAQVVVPGARVRIVDVSSNRPLMVGQLVRQAGDSVTILSEENLAAAAAHTVWVVGGQRRLEVRTAVHRHAAVGLLLGGMAGAAVGYAIGSSAPNNCANSWFLCISPAETGAMGGSLLGMVIGAVVGHGARSEDWRRVDQAPVGVAVSPGAQGMHVALSIAF